MKKCIKCNINKKDSSFDSYRKICKSCRNIYKRKKWSENKVKDVKTKLCNKCNKRKNISQFYSNRNSCKECVANYSKKYRSNNKSKRNKQVREKRLQDSFYKFKSTIRGFISNSIRRGGYVKGDEYHFEDIVGLNIEELHKYLEDNKYGFKLNSKIDIDHIIPLAKAKTFSEVIKLNHYTNLQLLPSKYNRDIKRDKKWNQKHFEDWYNKTTL
ncbi:MAG: hypothetical protein KC414_04860 [Romboutsia sp.]|nr:hypothetical protein [Romboutsia sp.]